MTFYKFVQEESLPWDTVVNVMYAYRHLHSFFPSPHANPGFNTQRLNIDIKLSKFNVLHYHIINNVQTLLAAFRLSLTPVVTTYFHQICPHSPTRAWANLALLGSCTHHLLQTQIST